MIRGRSGMFMNGILISRAAPAFLNLVRHPCTDPSGEIFQSSGLIFGAAFIGSAVTGILFIPRVLCVRRSHPVRFNCCTVYLLRNDAHEENHVFFRCWKSSLHRACLLFIQRTGCCMAGNRQGISRGKPLAAGRRSSRLC